MLDVGAAFKIFAPERRGRTGSTNSAALLNILMQTRSHHSKSGPHNSMGNGRERHSQGSRHGNDAFPLKRCKKTIHSTISLELQ
jgi:hypothetical protein